MAQITKTVDLYRHTHKDTGGNHVSYDGATYAYEIGSERYDEGNMNIHHLFWGPLARTCETAIAMMTANQAFTHVKMHDPIHGLGSSELFATIITDHVRADIKGGLSNMEAVLVNIDRQVLVDFNIGARNALKQMFDLMDSGQHGVGIFHDPTIPMLAKCLGMTDAHSLDAMEAIRFRLYDDGSIDAVWIEE
ncbi:MAG: hypothetical protein WCS88_02780 [Patescibacteria group bacterium]|jgi:hypothetical protein